MESPFNRRYPRIDCDRPAYLEVSTPSGPERAPVTIRAISLGGMGLAFDEWEEIDVHAGAWVTIRLPVDGTTLALPGRVAWIRHDPSARFDLGVMLAIDRLDKTTRRTYVDLVADPQVIDRVA